MPNAIATGPAQEEKGSAAMSKLNTVCSCLERWNGPFSGTT